MTRGAAETVRLACNVDASYPGIINLDLSGDSVIMFSKVALPTITCLLAPVVGRARVAATPEVDISSRKIAVPPVPRAAEPEPVRSATMLPAV